MLQEKFDAQLQYIISIDPIVRGEAYTLLCDESLSSDEMTIKLNDFITKKYNQEALDDVYQQIQKNQKKGFKMPHSEADQKKFFKIYLKREVNMKDHQTFHHSSCSFASGLYLVFSFS
jgi:isopropylmalate/homocitrate/citramalate synthase